MDMFQNNTLFSLFEVNHCEPYCRIRTIYTSAECTAMHIVEFDSLHLPQIAKRILEFGKVCKLLSVGTQNASLRIGPLV